MDLTNFTSSKKTSQDKNVIIDNVELKVTKRGEFIEFYFKKEESIKKYQDFLFFAPTNYIITDSERKAESFFKESIERGVEGLMFKNLNAKYMPGARVGAMAKVKETKEDIDVVILGAERGKGKRTGFYSSFLVGVKDDSINEESYLEIGKVSSGIKEKDEGTGVSMKKLLSLLEPLKISEKGSIVYFEPKIIIQVKYQEIQKSTTYSSGYALRFPRIITLREDKTMDEINTISDIKEFSST